MASKIRSRVTLVLKIGFAVGLIYYMINSGALNLNSLWNLMTIPNIVMALSLIGISTALCAYRWMVLLEARGFHINLRYGLNLYLIGMFFNYALPGAVSGDLVKGYYLVSDHPERKMDAAMSILIDRVLGLYSFFILALVGVAWDFKFVMAHEQIRWVATLTALIFFGMTAFFLMSFSERLHRLSGLKALTSMSSRFSKIQVIFEAFQRFGKNRKTIFMSVLFSVLAQITTVLFFYGLSFVLPEPSVTWHSVLFAVPMGFVVTAVPISPAGLGVGQVAFHYLFKTYLGHDTDFGSVAITAFQMAGLAWGLVGAVCYLRRGKPKRVENLAAAEAASS